MPHLHSSADRLPDALREVLATFGVAESEGDLIHEFERHGYLLWLSGPDLHMRSLQYRWMVTLRDHDGQMEPCISYGESAIVAMAKAFATMMASSGSDDRDSGIRHL